MLTHAYIIYIHFFLVNPPPPVSFKNLANTEIYRVQTQKDSFLPWHMMKFSPFSLTTSHPIFFLSCSHIFQQLPTGNNEDLFYTYYCRINLPWSCLTCWRRWRRPEPCPCTSPSWPALRPGSWHWTRRLTWIINDFSILLFWINIVICRNNRNRVDHKCGQGLTFIKKI